jgi:aspartate/methionine/tyrosine aminotransferase
VRNYFTITANVFGERLAAFALQHGAAIYGRARLIAQQNLVLLDQVFARHAEMLRWVRPAGGMTAFPWLASGIDTRAFCQELAQNGVLMAPGDCFGQPSHFRLGFAASGDRFPRALERFSEFLNNHRAQRGAANVGCSRL